MVPPNIGDYILTDDNQQRKPTWADRRKAASTGGASAEVLPFTPLRGMGNAERGAPLGIVTKTASPYSPHPF